MNAPEGRMPAPRAFGECQHPFASRWVAQHIDVEGCAVCGKALTRNGWETDELFADEARKAGVMPS